MCRSSSSNVNEVIRAISNLLFFCKKISHAQKAQKPQKAEKAQKAQKAQRRSEAKAPEAQKVQKKTKTQNVNKRISEFFYP